MRVNELRTASADSSLPKPVRDLYLTALGEQLSIDTSSQRHQSWVLFAAMIVLISMTVATGGIALLGSIGAVTVVDRYFNLLWATFGVGFLGTMGTNLAARLKS